MDMADEKSELEIEMRKRLIGSVRHDYNSACVKCVTDGTVKIYQRENLESNTLVVKVHCHQCTVPDFEIDSLAFRSTAMTIREGIERSEMSARVRMPALQIEEKDFEVTDEDLFYEEYGKFA